MPFYDSIDETTQEGKRTLEGLKRLRAHLKSEIPSRDINDTLLLATWNIREFDSAAYGDRSNEAFQYIAEIVSHFDLIAVQEVRDDLKALQKLRKKLGSWWEYIVSDVTEGSRGNHERMAFLYDSRKVKFGRIAGELVLPPAKDSSGELEAVKQTARTPFMCGFSCGWSKFILSTVHVLYGSSQANDQERVDEIDKIASFLKKRSKQSTAWSSNFILLGDFNIFRPGDETINALKKHDFVIPDQLQGLPANAQKNKHYDQIVFSKSSKLNFTGKAGVFDYYQDVYRQEDEKGYIDEMGDAYFTTSSGSPRTDPLKYYKNYWRTHQMSDHLPMWIQININASQSYLEKKMEKIEE